MYEPFFYFFAAVFLVISFWTIPRFRGWDKLRSESAQRMKNIMETAAAHRERGEEMMALYREHLQVTKELLSEIKALREDLGRNRSNIT